MSDSLPPIKGITDDVKSLVKEVKELYTELTKVMGIAGSALLGAKGVVSAGGSLGVGKAAGRPGTGADNAQFSGQAQQPSGNIMQGSLGGFSLGAMVLGTAKMALALPAAAFAAMPNAADTMGRATGYYQAALPGGVGYSRSSLEKNTLRALGVGTSMGSGLSFTGSDASVSAMLTQGIGMTPGSFSYLQTVQAVGGAQRYLGMSNSTAASAIGGLYTGPMGANLYQYGINTMDSKGNAIPEGQIARQLYSKIFNTGAKLNTSQMNNQIQNGWASSAALAPLGLDSAQITIMQQAFRDINAGINPDLAIKKATSAGSGNSNPAAAALNIAGSTTQLMQSSESGVIAGYTQAAKVIDVANQKMEIFATSLGHLSGLINGIGGSNIGRGAMVGSGIAGSALNTLGLAALLRGGTARSGSGLLSGAGRMLGGSLASVGTGLLGGKGASMLAKASGLSSGYQKGAGVLGGAAAGALTGAIFAPETLGLSVPLGALIGGISGFFGSGGGGQGYGASFGAKGGASSGAISPIPGVSTSAQYGQTDPSSLWDWKGYHTGQDYPVPVGTSVRATMDGIVAGDNLGKDYGTAIILNHPNGYQTIYGHLSSKLVGIGQAVHAGQIIGKSGQSGNVTGPHLHYEVRKGKNNPVDPAQLQGNSTPGSTATSTSAILASLTAPGLGNGVVTGGGQVFTAGGAAGGVSKTVVGGGSQQTFAKSLLDALGAPINKNNIGNLTTWMAYEGGNWKNSASFNPMNTTLDLPGSKSVNSVGVKAYGSWAQGLQATVGTLTGNQSGPRGYDQIVADLRAGNVSTKTFTGDIGKSSWGTFKKGGVGGGGQGYGASVSAPSVGGSKTVYVTLKIDQANEQEAVAFAKRIKVLLEDEASIAMIGG